MNKKELTKRSLSFGINSALITVVVIGIIGVLNFLGDQYPHKFDLTKNKIHTFSDQSEKVVKSLKSDLNATFYGDVGAREKYRPIFDNYKNLNPKFKLEIVDPNKEPSRAKSAGIKKMDTLVLAYQGKTSRVEDITEEKITNELIKLTKDNKSVVCAVIGHGEPSISDQGAGGFASAKKGLEDQAYTVREITLPQESKIPADCTVVTMLGASKALFPAEVKMISEYLNNGGRFIVGVDASIGGADQNKELKGLLLDWGVETKSALIIDPVSRMLGVDASVPIIAQFSKENPIVKDFTQQCYFPFARPLDVSSKTPEGIMPVWLAKTTPKAWGETDMSSIGKGQVSFNQGSDIIGPLTAAIAVNGKKKGSTATRETRLVVFGTSQFANNQYSRFGGNLDFFLNSVSWALEDESMISIRAKEDETGKVELSQNEGVAIFWITVVIAPLLIAVLGIVIWVRRKKL